MVIYIPTTDRRSTTLRSMAKSCSTLIQVSANKLNNWNQFTVSQKIGAMYLVLLSFS